MPALVKLAVLPIIIAFRSPKNLHTLRLVRVQTGPSKSRETKFCPTLPLQTRTFLLVKQWVTLLKETLGREHTLNTSPVTLVALGLGPTTPAWTFLTAAGLSRKLQGVVLSTRKLRR